MGSFVLRVESDSQPTRAPSYPPWYTVKSCLVLHELVTAADSSWMDCNSTSIYFILADLHSSTLTSREGYGIPNHAHQVPLMELLDKYLYVLADGKYLVDRLHNKNCENYNT